MSAAAAAGGVLVGGILTEALSWRWVLLINPTIGIAAAIVGWAVLADRERERERRAYDITGAITLTLGLMVLVYGLAQAGERGWHATIALGPIVAGLALLALFCVVETKVASDPLVPFKKLSRPLRAITTIVMIFSAALFPVWYLSSLYLQQVLGLTPIRAGLAFLPAALTIMLVAPATGRLVSRVGVRAVLATGLSMMAVGLLLFTKIAAGGSAVVYALVPGVLTAAGIGLSIVASTIAAVQSAPRGQASFAWGLASTSRQIGAGLGIAVLISLAAALTGHLIGHGRELPQALTDGFRLGYWIAAGLAAAAAVATLTLLRKPADGARPVLRRAEIAVGLGLLLVCFVGGEVAVGRSHTALGLYPSRRVQVRVGAGTSSTDRAGGDDFDTPWSTGERLCLHGQLLRPAKSADGGAERTPHPRPAAVARVVQARTQERAGWEPQFADLRGATCPGMVGGQHHNLGVDRVRQVRRGQSALQVGGPATRRRWLDPDAARHRDSRRGCMGDREQDRPREPLATVAPITECWWTLQSRSTT